MTASLGLAGWMLASLGLLAMLIARHRTRVRAELVARACHEVRGPLTAARLGLELEGRAGQSAQIQARAIGLELECASLALEELRLGWGSGGRKPVPLKPPGKIQEVMDLVRLLEECVEAWTGPAATRGVALRLVVPHDRVHVRAERARLAQAVVNLIVNALEHGGGPVEVSLRVEARTARVEVLDSGPGLPAPIAELVRRHRPGHPHGHGLLIAAGVAAACGGGLTAAPSAAGARVILTLPALAGASALSRVEG